MSVQSWVRILQRVPQFRLRTYRLSAAGTSSAGLSAAGTSSAATEFNISSRNFHLTGVDPSPSSSSSTAPANESLGSNSSNVADSETNAADEEEELKSRILRASLAHVGRHGWTRLALAAGSEDAGYISIVSGLFPRGGEDLVLYHVRESNRNLDAWMLEQLKTFQGSKLPIGRFIRSAVERRLLMNNQFIKNGRWAEALAILAKPQNVVESIGLLQELCDDIWHRAGDCSADLNWYSKRVLLAGVISSTEVFMLQDSSDNFQETWKFLDRRFADIACLPQLGKLPEDLTGLLSGVFTTAKNMVGVQK